MSGPVSKRHPLLAIATDIMNDRGRRILLRSLPFAGIVGLIVVLQPQYVGLEKIWGFFLVAVTAAVLLLAVLVLPRMLIVTMHANNARMKLRDFIESDAYQTIRQEWRET